jgi:acyl-coenzyme A thioesterase PaaI-like protein
MKQTNDTNNKQPLATEQRLSILWKRLGGSAAGRWIFNRLLSYNVPYSGSISPQVKKLSPGFAEVSMKDKRKLRNHLQCIHAIALANLGELTSGLAMISALSPSIRAIVSHIEMEYIKKARGTLSAAGVAKPPENVTKPTSVLVHAEIENQQGEIVAVAHVMWHLSPKEPR